MLTRMPTAAAHKVADDLLGLVPTLSGVVAPSETADAFAQRWTLMSGTAVRVFMELRLFQLSEVVMPAMPPGRFRETYADDAAIVADFIKLFSEEALDNPGSDDYFEMARKGIVAKKYVVWDVDGKVVSMAAVARTTPRGGGISTVYTPRDHRGRGYASACVAQLSQKFLQEGKRFCFLFTDLKNPTSNRIYQNVGYKPVCDFRHLHFGAVL